MGYFAVAQGAPDAKTTQDLKKEDPLPPATGRNLSEQAGTTEPGSKVETSKDENVFVNGVLSVQGALADVDTAPSKFSERTAADDRLPIVGYRLSICPSTSAAKLPVSSRFHAPTRLAQVN
jgi:hypothetical protein